MSFSSFIALRYLKSSRENRFFSWISILSIIGIAIGVAAMIAVLSVINGFEAELRKRFLHANAHILAYRYPAGMKDPERWAKVIQKDFKDVVRGVAPFIHYETMSSHKGVMQSVLIRGISPNEREKVQSLKEVVFPPAALDELQKEMDLKEKENTIAKIPAIIMGKGLLSLLDAKVGDVIRLIDPSSGNVSELKEFKVVGVYDSGLKHYDNKLAAISLVTAQSFFAMKGRVTGLEIGLFDPEKSIDVATQMEKKYSLTFREWHSFNQPLFETMKRERLVIAIIVFIVGLVASFNILTTSIVSVIQRQRDISILKALGARNNQILLLFLNQGMYMGAIGGVAGIALAYGISKFLEKYKFIELPDPYFLSSLPITYDPLVYIGVFVTALLICILFALYPALLAARVNPAEGFRGLVNAGQ